MFSSISERSFAAQLQRLGNGLTDLHEQIVATHEDVRALISIMLRCDRRANDLVVEIREATARLRQFNETA